MIGSDRLAGAVDLLVRRLGTPAVLVRVERAFDVAGQASAESESGTDLRALLRTVHRRGGDGRVTRRLEAFVPAHPGRPPPAVGDRLVVGAVSHAIRAVAPIAAGGADLVHRLELDA